MVDPQNIRPGRRRESGSSKGESRITRSRTPTVIGAVVLLLVLAVPSAWSAGAPVRLPASIARLAAVGGTWSECLPGPQQRSKQAAVYDSHRDRMIMFGGRCQDACCPDGPVGDDLWMLPLATDSLQWVRVWPGGISPGNGLGPAAIYDPVRDRMLLPVSAGHVWELALAASPTWSQLTVTGTGPSPSAPTAVYDPVRDQMVVVTSSGAWTLSLGASPAWTQLAPTGRAPTGVQSVVYDPLRDRLVVFGDSVRVLSLAGAPAWSALANNRMPRAHSAVYDSVRDRIVAHGGCAGSTCGTRETWALSLAGTPVWTQLSASGPMVSSHSAIYDAAHDRMVVFGGYLNQFYVDWSVRDLWTLSLSTLEWRNVTPPQPPRGCGITAILDPLRQRVIAVDDSVRVMGLAGLPTWSAIPAAGPAPSPRNGYAALYDPVRDRVVLYGGWVWDGAAKQPLTDLWTLALASPERWMAITPAGTSPPTAGPAVYDATRDRLLLIGDQRVWALSLGEAMQWSELAPTGAPPAADTGFSAIYDSPRDRVLVFGGGGGGGLTSDTWQLTLAPAPAWSALAPAGASPAARAGHMAIYDPYRDRMVISGGDTGAGTASDTWALTLAPQPAWIPLETGGVVNGRSTAIYDPGRDRMVALGTCAEAVGLGCPAPDPGLWALGFTGVLDVPPVPRSGPLSLAQSRPNPALGSALIPFTLERPGVVRVCVYDVAGRPIRTVFDGALAVGAHTVRWDGMCADGSRARPGAYFYELTTAGRRMTQRLLLLR